MLAHPSITSSPIAPEGVNEPMRRQVTVVIAAWRAANTIKRAVASALAQPETAEVVVVDDASNDDGATLAAARAADDGTGRLTVLALDVNSGPSRARNAAIRASKAPWITILDSDDFFEPNRLGPMMALADKGYDLIADDLMQTPESQPGSAGRMLWFEQRDAAPIDVDLSFFVGNNIIRSSRMRRELGFLKPMIRRAFLERHGISYDESMRLGEDYDLYARSLSFGAKMRLIPWTGYVSVMRGNSLSLNHKRADLAALEAADSRLLASGRVNQTEAKLVKRHRFSTRYRLLWIDFMTAAKKGEVFRAGWVVVKDPRQAPKLFAALGRMVVEKLQRGKNG